MPTSKETRVRSDGFSKMTATDSGPASGRYRNRSAFMVTARSRTSAWSTGLGGGVKGGRQRGQEGLDLLGGHDQGRRQAYHVWCHGVGQEARLLHEAGDRRRAGPAQDDAQEQTGAAYSGDERVAQTFDAGAQQLADPLGVVEQALGLDRVQHRESGGAAHRVAAERAAVAARSEQGGRVAERDAGAERQAAAEPLGERDHIWLDAFRLVGEPVPGAADAGLYLVQRQQRAVL